MCFILDKCCTYFGKCCRSSWYLYTAHGIHKAKIVRIELLYAIPNIAIESERDGDGEKRI